MSRLDDILAGSAASGATSQASLGIDVAKAKFDAALLLESKALQRTFAMTCQGFEALHAWIRKQEVDQAPVCLEASGE